MKLAQPLLWISYLKEGGPELYADIYGSINWYWELQDSIPSAKKFVEASMKKFNMPPGDYGAYSYSGVLEVARGVELAKSTDSEAVANALRKSPVYDHFKGKEWWRACDNKAMQDMWIVKGRGPGKTKGDWGLMEIVAKVAADEKYDRYLRREGPRVGADGHLARRGPAPDLHRSGAGDALRAPRHRPVADLRAHDRGQLLARGALHAGRLLHRVRSRLSRATSGWRCCWRRSWSGRSGSSSSASSSGGSTVGARTIRCC